MKFLRKNILEVMLLAFFVCTFAALPGCKTPPATIAYKTESAADVGVRLAMTAWGAYVADKHPGVAAELKVRDAFEKTKKAELALIDATSAWVAASPSSGGATNTPPDVTAAQAAFSQTVVDLRSLVTSFGVVVPTK